MNRCEHNCHLCKNEWLGRCGVDGKDVSVNDKPICEKYNYGGTALHLKEIHYAEKIGVNELNDEQLKEVEKEYNQELKNGIRNEDGLTEEEFLKNYKPGNYERPSVTVDMLILGMDKNYNDLKILLIKRGNHPYMNKWALPGGFVDMKESMYQAAQRELEEETRLKDIYMEQLYTFSQPNRDPRMRVIDTAYIGLTSIVDVYAGDDAKDAAWFDIFFDDETLELYNDDRNIRIEYRLEKKNFKNGVITTVGYTPILNNSEKIKDGIPVVDDTSLAFDHAEIILEGLLRLRNKVQYTDIAFNLVPEEFTLSDLQRVNEVILGTELYKKNFRDKIKDKIVDTGKKGKSVIGNKKAELYRYKNV